MKQLQDLFKKHKAIVFFDTETTGLDATRCQVIELAALKVVPGADGTPVFPKQKDIKKQPMFTCLQTKEYCY